MIVRNVTAIAAGLVLASPVSGHHSDAGLDMKSMVAFEGTVTEFAWRNPHVYFSVATTDERTAYMDGRGHPEASERTLTGHSIGRWEGDVLGLDTTNSADHRSPFLP